MGDSTITVALISMLGTIIGSGMGVIVSNKMTNFRLDQLEKKMDKFSDQQAEIKERQVMTEQSTKSAHKRLDIIYKQMRIPDTRAEE